MRYITPQKNCNLENISPQLNTHVMELFVYSMYSIGIYGKNISPQLNTHVMELFVCTLKEFMAKTKSS